MVETLLHGRAGVIEGGSESPANTSGDEEASEGTDQGVLYRGRKAGAGEIRGQLWVELERSMWLLPSPSTLAEISSEAWLKTCAVGFNDGDWDWKWRRQRGDRDSQLK